MYIIYYIFTLKHLALILPNIIQNKKFELKLRSENTTNYARLIFFISIKQ